MLRREKNQRGKNKTTNNGSTDLNNLRRKYEINIGPLIEEATMTGTDWKTKEEMIQQDFLCALGPEATDQIKRSEYRSEPDNNKLDKILKLCSYYLPEINKYSSRGEFFGRNNKIRKQAKITGRN